MSNAQEIDQLEKLQAEYSQHPSPELRKEIHGALMERSESTFDMDNVQPVQHRFVNRGVVISCEGAGHPNHRHFIRT